MTSKDFNLNLWEQNFVDIPAVQGESGSRIVNFHLKEEANVENALGNLEIRQKPVDLTGCGVRLYCVKPDGTKIFCDGTVSDAANGAATFTLPYQATTAVGDVECQILVTKSDKSALKAIGLALNVQSSNLDGAVGSTSDFSALVTALAKAEAVKSATINVGKVTTGAAGSTATIINSGTENAAVFDFSIPKGDKGDTGPAGTSGVYPELTAGTELQPNTKYDFGTVTALTLTFAAPISGYANEYLFCFKSGDTAATLSLPSAVKWIGGKAPAIAVNKSYIVSIVYANAEYLARVDEF